MAFILAKKIVGGETGYTNNLLPVDGLAVSEGMILKYGTAGRVDLAGNVLPEFVCLSNVPASTPSTKSPVLIRVQKTDEFTVKTTFTVPSTSVGLKYVVNANSVDLTNSTSGGVFTVIATDGVANGSTVRGIFE